MSANILAHTRSSSQAREGRSLWKTGLVAGMMAAAANAVVFGLAVAAGIFPSLTLQPDLGAQMSIEPVLLVSVVGALAGVGAFSLLRSRVSRPVPVFLGIAAAVLLLSVAAPFAIPGTAAMQAVVLNVLHVVVAGFVVAAVLRTQSV